MNPSQAASSQDLGVLLHRYTVSKQVRFKFTFWLVILATIFVATIILVFSTAENLNILDGLSLVFVLLTIFATLAGFLLFYLKCELYLYESGAVEKFGIWQYSARYEDIKVWHGAMGFGSVPTTLNNHYYWVKFPDRPRHQMFYFGGRYNEAAVRLMELVYNAQIPRVMKEFNTGQSITFDKIKVGKEGLKIDSKTFLWSEGYHLELAHGTFMVIKYETFGRKAFATMEYKDIPNVLIFIKLLQSINKLPT